MLNRHNENPVLECLWVGEPTNCTKTLAYVKVEKILIGLLNRK